MTTGVPMHFLLLQVALTQVAESRLQGAIDVISTGKVVVTNRLHAAIVANLVGRPLIWIDTEQKKISGEWLMPLYGGYQMKQPGSGSRWCLFISSSTMTFMQTASSPFFSFAQRSALMAAVPLPFSGPENVGQHPAQPCVACTVQLQE